MGRLGIFAFQAAHQQIRHPRRHGQVEQYSKHQQSDGGQAVFAPDPDCCRREQQDEQARRQKEAVEKFNEINQEDDRLSFFVQVYKLWRDYAMLPVGTLFRLAAVNIRSLWFNGEECNSGSI
ncbi:hypothetical protein D3C76_1609110 [compost metagenome]